MAKTTTQTAPVTKMTRARALYAEITKKAAPAGKTHRGMFMDRCAELDLSAKAANTYFQNIKMEQDGSSTTSTTGRQTVAGLKKDLKDLRTMATELNQRLNEVAKKVA